MLHEFVNLHRDEIIRRCRAKAAARSVYEIVPAEIEHGVPLFLDQLVTALRLGASGSPEISGSALLYGRDVLAQGMSLSQVVHGYGDVCQSIAELALETNAPISTNEFRMLSGCLDGAIAGAVTEYGREGEQARALAASTPTGENEQIGLLAHELRDLLHTLTMAFDVVKSGHVGITGSTSRVIDRSLQRARDLIARSLAGVRLNVGVEHLEAFPVTAFIEELMTAGGLQASIRGIRLIQAGSGDDAIVQADHQILTTALMNLLHNALKFSRPHTTVTLRVLTTADRVLIEIHDECGGLPDRDVEELFRPFQQRHENRTGLGLGLVFTRKAVEAIGGSVTARNIPLAGCIFSVDLPRVLVAAAALSH